MVDYQSALAKKSASAERKKKREEKAEELWGKKLKRPKSKSISKLKKELWTEISKIVRSWNRGLCLPCLYFDRVMTPAECAAHIVPANDSAATKFFLPNLYPCCIAHNMAEKNRRGQWVKKHEEIFGAEYVDALYSMSRETFQIKRFWLEEQIERMRKLKA